MEYYVENFNKFSYEYFMKNRYSITEFIYGKEEYTALCNNGFIRLHGSKGRAYWLAQNELEHLTPDWKLHVSVVHEDVPKAWNLISNLFVKFKSRSGMKVAYLKENTKIARGREITIYIYKFDEEYRRSSEIGQDWSLDLADEHSQQFWFCFIEEVERLLKSNRIRTNLIAKGDLAIGHYVSLRNEAYIFDKKLGKEIYPPDEAGWNAAQHEPPFDLRKFRAIKKRINLTKNFILIMLSLGVLLISVLIGIKKLY
jgi:hypothetical protein